MSDIFNNRFVNDITLLNAENLNAILDATDDLKVNKVDKVAGKELSSNDYTDAEKIKLGGIESGAEVNIIEGVRCNGKALTLDDKIVDISVPTVAADIGAADLDYVEIELTKKASESHTHGNSDLTGIANWAKGASKPTYSANEVNAVPNSATITINGINKTLSSNPSFNVSDTTCTHIFSYRHDGVLIFFTFINNSMDKLSIVDLCNVLKDISDNGVIGYPCSGFKDNKKVIAISSTGMPYVHLVFDDGSLSDSFLLLSPMLVYKRVAGKRLIDGFDPEDYT